MNTLPLPLLILKLSKAGDRAQAVKRNGLNWLTWMAEIRCPIDKSCYKAAGEA